MSVTRSAACDKEIPKITCCDACKVSKRAPQSGLSLDLGVMSQRCPQERTKERPAQIAIVLLALPASWAMAPAILGDSASTLRIGPLASIGLCIRTEQIRPCSTQNPGVLDLHFWNQARGPQNGIQRPTLRDRIDGCQGMTSFSTASMIVKRSVAMTEMVTRTAKTRAVSI